MLALDSLNQAAKQLRGNQERTGYNLSRYSRHFPLVEKVRDSFDSTLPFLMDLTILPQQNTRITFNFLEPTPCGGGSTPPCLPFDDFLRTAGPDTWGTSSSGYNYGVYDTPTLSVSSGFGLIGLSGGTGIAGVSIPTESPDNPFGGPFASFLAPSNDFTMTTQFKISAVETGSDPDALYFQPWNGATTLLILPTTLGSFGQISIFDNTTNFYEADFTDWAVDTLYSIKWNQVYGGVGRVKLWRASDPEPGTWNLISGSTDPAFNGHNYFVIKGIAGTPHADINLAPIFFNC
jgi:hypothetical protein